MSRRRSRIGCVKLVLRRKTHPAAAEGQARHGESLGMASSEASRRHAHKKAATIWGSVLIGTGLLALAGSLLRAMSWAEAGISIGTGLVMAGVVFVLEPRFVRDIGEVAGKAAIRVVDERVDERTAELTERVEHLESLRALQDRVTANRQSAESALLDKVREQPDFESTAELLEKAQDQRLFSDLRLRTGSDRETLMSMTWERASPDVLRALDEFAMSEEYEYLDADLLIGDHILLHVFSLTGEASSARSPWSPTQTMTEAWNAFLDACGREGVPATSIDLVTVFEALAASYEAMIDSRRSPPGDPRKIQGRLILLVNDEWAITDAGLESRVASYSSQSCPEEGERSPAGHDEQLWQEAVSYWPVVEATAPQGTPPNSFDEPF